MELIYIWIDNYRTFNNTEINLSNKFKIHYNQKNNKIIINENHDLYNIYPASILNITAILGKNSAGKSNLLDLIGMRIKDRNNLKEEFEIKYKNKGSDLGIYRYPDDVEEERKNSQYFFLYYVGKDSNGINQFCFEGNDIEKYITLCENTENISAEYYKSKYWFAFNCIPNRGKLVYINTVQDSSDRTNNTYVQSIKDKTAIILFRENYNGKYYDTHSFESEDEQKIALPRRIASFSPDFLYKSVNFLFKQMAINNRTLYANNEYFITITYSDNLYISLESDIGIIKPKNLKKFNLTKSEYFICKLLSCFCYYFYDTTTNSENERKEKVINYKGVISNLKCCKDNYKDVKNYYYSILNVLATDFFKKDDQEELEFFFKRLTELVAFLEELFLKSKNVSGIQFNENSFEININKNTDMHSAIKLIQMTIDENHISKMNKDPFSVFQSFFTYSIDFLSDGEMMYLGLMSSIDEQITLKTQIEGSTNRKEHFILLFDEPETRMHPELARMFLKNLIDFLEQYKNKTFQIILASHSPFLISDIPKENILTVIKNDSNSIIQPCNFDTFAQNIHVLLKNAFFMDATMGAYALSIIQEINDYLENDSETVMNINEVEQVVNMVGEVVIKSVLQEKLKSKKSEFRTTELADIIKKYDDLSSEDKDELIRYIINLGEGGR